VALFRRARCGAGGEPAVPGLQAAASAPLDGAEPGAKRAPSFWNDAERQAFLDAFKARRLPGPAPSHRCPAAPAPAPAVLWACASVSARRGVPACGAVQPPAEDGAPGTGGAGVQACASRRPARLACEVLSSQHSGSVLAAWAARSRGCASCAGVP